MSMRFDRLTLLETFVRIAERKSLSQAARDLGTSQPSVSRQLAALEDRLGVILARRTTHDVTLTPDGLSLLNDAQRLLGEWEAIEERNSDNGDLKGNIRVVAPVALGQKLLVRFAASFMKSHPNITIDWQLRDNDIRFSEEGCDCWLKVGPVPDDTLVVRELVRVERLVVGSPEYLIQSSKASLDTLPWLTLDPFEGSKIKLFDKHKHVTTLSVKPRLKSNNIFAVLNAVKDRLGVAIMPYWLVSSELKNRVLVDVVPDLRASSLPVNLAIAAGTKRPARLEQFCIALQNWCNDYFPNNTMR